MRCDRLLVVAVSAVIWTGAVRAELLPNGVLNDERASVFYDPSSGEIAIDAPAGESLTSVNFDSAACIFTGDPAWIFSSSGNDSDCNIFDPRFGSSFDSYSYGNVAQPGLSEEAVRNDLTVVGSLFGGHGMGNVDLVYQSWVLLPDGVVGDSRASIVYNADTGEVAVEAPAGTELSSVSIRSMAGIFAKCPPRPPEDGGFPNCDASGLLHGDRWIPPFLSFTTHSWGNVALSGLSRDFILSDLSVHGSVPTGNNWRSAFGFGSVDLIYIQKLYPGDANQDFSFDQLDIVQVLQAGKYLTGESATWGEGDWNGGPGGYPGEPLAGDGLFDQQDIVAALQTGAYLNGAYAAIARGGVQGDEQASIIYDARTGEIAVDAPASTELRAIDIDSAAGIFTGESPMNLGGCWECDADNNIFKATPTSTFGSLSFGNVAKVGLSEEFVRNDLTVVGSLAGGGDLGNVDLVWFPEPSSLLLALLGIVGLLRSRIGRLFVVRTGRGATQ